jgi:hypothetical protein
MRSRIPAIMLVVVGLTLVLGDGLYAQLKEEGDTGLNRISGLVHEINKDKSILTLRQKNTVGKYWEIAYNDKTAVTLRNKPAKMEDLKTARHVIVLCQYENDKLMATRIEIRDEK